MEYPEAVARLKPELREQCRVDMSGFSIDTRGRSVVPYDGESVWLEPYIDTDTELELMQARDDLGENPGDEESFTLMTDILAKLTFGWNLTDKYGEVLPQPTDGDAIRRLPSRAVLYLLNEALGLESEGEGSAVSVPTANGSLETAAPPTKPKLAT